MALHIVILAAGQGKRMYSDLPKVLHPLAGKPMLQHVIDTANQLNPEKIHVIIGHGREKIQQALRDLDVNWVIQEEQKGTGHAVTQALPHIPAQSQVLILSGDVPLIKASLLEQLLARCSSSTNQAMPLGLLVAHVTQPFGLGRVVHDEQQRIIAIVEEKDATEQQKEIREIYSGICCAGADDLKRWLPLLKCENAQGEYYLTEMITLAVAQSHPIVSLAVDNEADIQGVNNRVQLHHLERIYQQSRALQLMEQGVSIADGARIDIRGDLECGKDVFIDVNVIFEGRVKIGSGCRIGPNCVLTNVSMGDGCEIFANSVLEGCTLANNCHIGPFARIRPGTQLRDACKVGNFVEMKNAVVDVGSKASHLSYLGDVRIGKDVNIGAGTITCNYDGVNKHQTIIEDGVFIGSDTQLVAPVTIGKEATIGAGSSIRKDVPAGELTLTLSKQKTIYGWTRPKKIS